MKITTSKRFTVNFLDIAKGFLIAAITAVIATCGQVIDIWLTSPTFSIDKVNLVMIIKVAIGGGVAYLVKNFFSRSKVVMTEEKSDKDEKPV